VTSYAGNNTAYEVKREKSLSGIDCFAWGQANMQVWGCDKCQI